MPVGVGVALGPGFSALAVSVTVLTQVPASAAGCGGAATTLAVTSSSMIVPSFACARTVNVRVPGLARS